MTTNAKIALSSKEVDLVCNTEWILTKQGIIDKVYGLFGDLLPELEEIMVKSRDRLPGAIFLLPAKISKGEQYHHLPYVMLDYPRHFNKDETVAIRTFFWWGNFFSVNLQLSGIFKDQFAVNIRAHFDYLQQNDFWVCVHTDPWQHHFEEDNYLPLKAHSMENFEHILYRESFVKIGKKISLQQWQEAPGFIKTSFGELIRLIQSG